MSNETSRWQRSLLPLMVGMVVFAALAFAAISVREFERVQATLDIPTASTAAILSAYGEAAPDTTADRLLVADRKAAFVLERESLARRYSQAHAIVLARLWTRFMAFMTGTLMALVGSAFVLGKLQEGTTNLSGTGANMSVTLTSASPGIILATLGTVLMVAGLASSFKVETTDPPTYFGRLDAPGGSAGGSLSPDVMQAAPTAPPPAKPADADGGAAK